MRLPIKGIRDHSETSHDPSGHRLESDYTWFLEKITQFVHCQAHDHPLTMQAGKEIAVDEQAGPSKHLLSGYLLIPRSHFVETCDEFRRRFVEVGLHDGFGIRITWKRSYFEHVWPVVTEMSFAPTRLKWTYS